jgi:hypothetical protein
MDENVASDGNSGQDQQRFVGYQTQLDQAEHCFQEVLTGAARVLLITGDEGIGKQPRRPALCSGQPCPGPNPYEHRARAGGAWTAAEQCLTMQLEPEHIFGVSGSTLELAVPLFLNLVQGYAGKGFESDAGVCAVEAAQTTDADLLPLLCAVAEIGYLMSDP